jgi:hypothetical protein
MFSQALHSRACLPCPQTLKIPYQTQACRPWTVKAGRLECSSVMRDLRGRDKCGLVLTRRYLDNNLLNGTLPFAWGLRGAFPKLVEL